MQKCKPYSYVWRFVYHLGGYEWIHECDECKS